MDDDILEARKSWVDKMVKHSGKTYFRPPDDTHIAFVIRVLASVAGYFLHGIVHEIQILTSGFVKNTLQPALPALPNRGHLPHIRSLSRVCGARQYLAWYYPRALRHLYQELQRRGRNCWSRRWWLLASPLASVVLWEPRRLLCLPVRPSVPI